ncbi:MAG: histidine kinase [Alphaproteobacteria bacterium]|nr:histidine kinase [Alphaproteobacteria bacterium]
MDSDTNTKSLLHKVSTSIPSYAGLALTRFNLDSGLRKRRSYNPARMIFTVSGVNLIPVILLVFGLILLGQYRTNLITSQLELLHTQSELYVTILKNRLYESNNLDSSDPMNTAVQSIFKNLDKDVTKRLVMFDQSGAVLADSLRVDNFGTDADAGRVWLDLITENLLSNFFNVFKIEYDLPEYPYTDPQNATSFPGVETALKGKVNLSVWSANGSRLVFSSALPIIINGEIAGVLSVSKLATEVDQTLQNLKNDIFRIFFIILFISLSVSLLLVSTITTPLRRLAKAAETIRTGQGKETEIPDMSNRGDEIGELSIALRSLVHALWERMRSIESFAADVSHELKNPITSMRSALETLPFVNSEEDRQQLINILQNDVTRLDRLVTDISRASRLDAELARDEGQIIDIGGLLEEVAESYNLRLDNNQEEKTVRLRNKGNMPTDVAGSPERLVQVFNNIIDNALSFSPDDGIISIIIETKYNDLFITIEDQGPGLNTEDAEKIFQRFYTSRPEHEGFGQHSGLGLSISRQIIEAHSGSLTAGNKYDENKKITGARFVIRLPLTHID